MSKILEIFLQYILDYILCHVKSHALGTKLAHTACLSLSHRERDKSRVL